MNRVRVRVRVRVRLRMRMRVGPGETAGVVQCWSFSVWYVQTRGGFLHPRIRNRLWNWGEGQDEG